MTVFEQVRDIIAETLKIDPQGLTDTSAQETTAGWDSLVQVNLMMALEQTFDLQLEVEDFAVLNSVPAILAYLKARGIS